MKLLFLDLDGTLLNDEKEISAGDLAAINDMVAKGHKVIINSGRPLYSILIIANKFHLDREGFFISAFNGGLVYNPFTKEKLKNDNLTDDIARHLLDEAYKMNIHAHTYTDEYVVSEKDTEELRFYTGRIKMPPLVVDDFTTATKGSAPKVILISLDGREKLEKYREKLSEYEKEKNMYSTFSDAKLLEYANPLANKGEAIRFMCEYLSVDIKDTIAAGDEENDLPMITTAGIGVCMKNGVDKLKAYADYITECTNNECGIKEIIEKFVLFNE